MVLDARRLLDLTIPPRSVSYSDRDVMLYALAVGAGAEGGASDIDLVYEKALSVIPSFANMLAFDDSWFEAGGVDLRQVVHGALELTFHAPLALEGTAEIATGIGGLQDKGEGKAAIIVQETSISQAGNKACTSVSSLFVRGGGGFGGSVGTEPPMVRLPDAPAEIEVVVPTAPNQALLFRLLGDRNPLHADMEVARQSGFDRPILHGACTFGIACLTVIRSFCGGDPSRLSRFAARFTGPLVPGQALQFSFWRDAEGVFFRAVTADGRTPVLDGGRALVKT